MSPRPWVTFVVLAFLCAIWSSTWLVIKTGLADLPVFYSAALRFTIAGSVFVVIAPWLHPREGGDRPPWWMSLTMGSLNFAASYGIVYWAETVLPSGLASVLWATFPMWIAASSHLFIPGERMDARRWLGFGVAFLGVTGLFIEDLTAMGGNAVAVGAVFLLSPFVAAMGQIVVKRYGEEVSSVLLNRNAMIIGAVILWCVAASTEHFGDARWTSAAVFSLVYLAIPGTVVTFGLYYWLLRHGSATRLSLIAYVIPVAAVALGVLVGDEPFTGSLAGGTALVLAGVGLATVTQRPASTS